MPPVTREHKILLLLILSFVAPPRHIPLGICAYGGPQSGWFHQLRPIIEWVNWNKLSPTRPQKSPSPPLIVASGKPYEPTLPGIITQEPIFYDHRYNKESKMSQPHIGENTDSSRDPNYSHNTNCDNTTNSSCIFLNDSAIVTNNTFSNVWHNCTIADEDSGIFAWLSPLEPQKRHYDIRRRRVERVGDWLLQTEEYRNWLGGTGSEGLQSPVLFCYGGPGVGKTYIR